MKPKLSETESEFLFLHVCLQALAVNGQLCFQHLHSGATTSEHPLAPAFTQLPSRLHDWLPSSDKRAKSATSGNLELRFWLFARPELVEQAQKSGGATRVFSFLYLSHVCLSLTCHYLRPTKPASSPANALRSVPASDPPNCPALPSRTSRQQQQEQRKGAAAASDRRDALPAAGAQ
eukprot:5093071-Pleurochrysis_carterae.AAC.4